MNDGHAEGYEIMMATFPTEDGAREALDTLEDMAKNGVVEIIDAAELVRDAHGEVTIKQRSLPSPKRGAIGGAVVGGIIGLLFPPALVGSALLGAGIGAGGAQLAKVALKDRDLEQAAKDLEPGTSAAIAVVEATWVEQMSKAMQGYDKLAEHALDATNAMHLGLVDDPASGLSSASLTAHATDPDTGAVAAVDYTGTVDEVTGAVAESGAAMAVDPSTGTVAAQAFEAVGVPGAGELEAADEDAGDDESADQEE